MLGGALSAAAGLFLAASATAGDATTGNGFMLTSIVAVVLGGISLFGGRGSAVGAIMGALRHHHDRQHPVLRPYRSAYQAFYEGLFLVIAVARRAIGIGADALMAAGRRDDAAHPRRTGRDQRRVALRDPRARSLLFVDRRGRAARVSPASGASSRCWSSPPSWASSPPGRCSSS